MSSISVEVNLDGNRDAGVPREDEDEDDDDTRTSDTRDLTAALGRLITDERVEAMVLRHALLPWRWLCC